MRYLLYALMIVFMSSGVMAYDLCDDTKPNYKNCTMVTPVIYCGNVSYAIYNVSSHAIVKNDSPTSLGDGIYTFNFTEKKGDYLIKLCDGTTREIRVGYDDGDTGMLGAIILIPMILGIMLLVASFRLGDNHPSLGIFLFLISLITFFSSAHIATVGIIHVYGLPEIQETIGWTVYIFGMVLFVIITYIIIYYIYTMLNSIWEKKRERIEY